MMAILENGLLGQEKKQGDKLGGSDRIGEILVTM